MKSDSKEEMYNTFVSSKHNYKLKYKNEDSVGFRESRYKDSLLTSTIGSSNINQKSYFSRFFKQSKLMIWKNYLVSTRNYKPTLFQLITPIAICILLICLQYTLDVYNSHFINKDPEIIELKNVSKCLYPDDCTTIGYGIIVRYFNIE